MNQKLQITKNYVLRKIVDESILVPISPNLKQRDCLYVLNQTGHAIYQGVLNGLNIEQICENIRVDFDVSSPQLVENDISAFLQEMIEIEAVSETS